MMIRAIIKRPGRNPYVTHISNTLEALQKNVDGYIEAVTISSNYAIICNEEGLINNMQFNCRIYDYHFFGPILFVGVDGDEFCDFPLSYEEFKKTYFYLFDRNLEVI